jgi:hypothetical protein
VRAEKINMKVIVYQDQKKITVNNIVIPRIDDLMQDLDEKEYMEINKVDLQLYNFRITSTRAATSEEEILNDEIEREIEEGDNWQQETVN